MLHLHGSVYEKAEIVEAKTDDLNGVLKSKSIVYKQQLIDEPENIQGEEGWNGTRSTLMGCIPFEAGLKRCEHIAIVFVSSDLKIMGQLGECSKKRTGISEEHSRLEPQHYSCLNTSYANESPRP